MNNVEYSVVFRNPSQTNTWTGTAVLNGSNEYTIEGIKAVTEDGASHTLNVRSDDTRMSWSLETGENNGKPVSFVAMLKRGSDTSTTYRLESAVNNINVNTPYPIIFAISDDTPLYLEVKSASDLKRMDKDTNYYLANDITLDSSTLDGEDWDGPTGYRKHFNGNGKTITLELVKTNPNNKDDAKVRDTGLFNSLSGNAIIENFNIKVKTKANSAGYLQMVGRSHFGGVVGAIGDAGDYILRDISITGELKYKVGNEYLLAGGLIGEIRENIGRIEIENCSSSINIDVTTNSTSRGTLGFGGLIGKSAANKGTVSITNCLTGGKIIGKITGNGNRELIAGGIIGDIGQTSGGNEDEELTIKNCYSTTTIKLERDSTNAGNAIIAAGGLIGYYKNTNAATVISKSVALNPQISVSKKPNSNDDPNVYANRVIGYINNDSNKHKGTMANNCALSTMEVKLNDVSAPATSDANNVDGLSKTADELKIRTTWVSALGFSEDNWDFSNIAKDGYPTLKLKLSN
jgi:hypothetical protein